MMERAKMWLIVCLLIFVYGSKYINCDVKFQYDTEQCLDQLEEYQCTVTGSGILVLTWRLLNNDGTELDTQPYVSSSLASGTDTIGGGEFTVEQLSTSPLVSNISFNAQSSINGYTIICEDGIAMNSKNVTIIIEVLPIPIPENITISFFESVHITWVLPVSQCVAFYTVDSNATNSTITTSDTYVIIPYAMSAGIYFVRVAAMDTAVRTGNYSKEECFELNVPLPPNITFTLKMEGENTYNVSVVFHHLNIPPVIDVYILFEPNTVDRLFLDKEAQSDTTTFIYEVTLQSLNLYTVIAYGRNAMGNGSTTTINYTSSYLLSSVSSVIFISSSVYPSAHLPNSSGIDVIGITTGVVSCFVIIGIVIIGIVLVTVALSCKKQKQSDAFNPNQKKYSQTSINESVELSPSTDTEVGHEENSQVQNQTEKTDEDVQSTPEEFENLYHQRRSEERYALYLQHS